MQVISWRYRIQAVKFYSENQNREKEKKDLEILQFGKKRSICHKILAREDGVVLTSVIKRNLSTLHQGSRKNTGRDS
jgi:hypothetical protein